MDGPQKWHDKAYKDAYEAFVEKDWKKIIGYGLADFPDTLRIMIFQCFGSEIPAIIYWSSALIQIYNGPFRRSNAQNLHPELMGAPRKDGVNIMQMPEARGLFSALQQVFREGRSESGYDVCLFRTGSEIEIEETFCNFSISPIRTATGEIVGVYVLTGETTETIIGRRQDRMIQKLQAARLLLPEAAQLFDAILHAAKDTPQDIPCIMGYHCNERLIEAGERTYSPILSAGVDMNHAPSIVGTAEAKDWVPGSVRDRDLRDFMLEVLHYGKSVRITDPKVISRFCQRRAFGDVTKTIWLCPIYCLDHSRPAGISILGMNPRRKQDNDILIQRFNREILESIETMSRRQAITDELELRTLELAASQRRFEVMAKHCPAGIFILNTATGVYEFANDAYYSITGIPSSADISDWREFVHEDSLAAAEKAWDNVFSENIELMETRWKTPWRGDIERWTTSSVVTHKDATGTTYVFGAFLDSSAIKYALRIERERANVAVKTKQLQLNFLDMIAHELRNPLGAITQSSDFLIEKLSGGSFQPGATDRSLARIVTEDDVEDLRTIVLCAQHMSRIINDTLNLSKLEGGMLIATHVPTQPVTVLKTVLAMFDAEIRRSDIDVRFIIDDTFTELGIDWILTDPSRFTQVVINLLANSLKFVAKMQTKKITILLEASLAPMATKVEIDSHHALSSKICDEQRSVPQQAADGAPLYIICRIRDTGPGMSQDQVASLFQRYFQASPRTHVEYGGSGLGLFISKQLVDLLKGTISVESVKNQGTVFSFSIAAKRCVPPSTLVTLDTRYNVADEETTRWNSPNQQAPDTILIAEDNLINQKLLLKQLTNVGIKTLIANNGQEAIDILVHDRQTDAKIAVCLCDIEMPVMGGIEAVRIIRKLESEGVLLHGHCPFVAVSANARQEQIAEMLAAGMDDSVPKPYKFAELLSKIDNLMQRLQLPPVHKHRFTNSEHTKKQDTTVVIDKKVNHVASLQTKAGPSRKLRHRSFSDILANRMTKSKAGNQPSVIDSFNLILLNTPISQTFGRHLWKTVSHHKPSLRICADGATDRLHREMFACELPELGTEHYPDIVLGDLDSIEPLTKRFYQESGKVDVIEIQDQNSTDFTKAVRHLEKIDDVRISSLDILVLGGIDGRLDQTFSTLNSLFLRDRIYLIDDVNLVMLLQEGEHEIDCSGLGKHCGLVPFQKSVRCWNTGLEWCLNGEVMEFGGLISTNNRVVSEDRMLWIRCDGPVVFSIELE